MTTQYAMTAIYNGTTRINWVVTGAPDLTGAQSGYPTGLLTSIATDYTTTSAVTAAGNTFFSNVWQTALEIDFTAQPNQTLGTDGTVTIAGLSWTKANSANERTATVITNGTGLVWSPTSTGDYFNATRTTPLLTLNLSSLIPNFTLDTPIRAWMYESTSNEAANFDSCIVALERPASNTNYVLKRSFSSGNVQNCSANVNGTNSGQTNSTGVYTGNGVLVVECPDGVASIKCRHLVGAFGTGSFPGYSTLTSVGNFNGETGLNDVQFLGKATDWNFLIGSHRAGSSNNTYTSTIARIRIEYININGNANVVASSGVGSNRPPAVGSGRLYFVDDAPIVYIDDPTTSAWKGYSSGYVNGSPGTGWTAVGTLGITQRGDALLATAAANNKISTGLKTLPAGVVAAGPWITEVVGEVVFTDGSTYPEFGVVVSNGTTAGTSNALFCGIYNYSGNTHSFGAWQETLNTQTRPAVYFGANTNNAAYPANSPNYFRIVNDGTNYIYQYSLNKGAIWKTFFNNTVAGVGLTITNFGFSVGCVNGAGYVAANILGCTMYTPTQFTITTGTIGTFNGTAGFTFTTSVPHNMSTGFSVTITGVTYTGTATTPNAVYDATVQFVSATQFFVPGGGGGTFTYTSGGTVTNTTL